MESALDVTTVACGEKLAGAYWPFLVTVDAEGDNVWARQKSLTTANSRELPRFQAFCESYKIKPTYFTTFEMATCGHFQEFARDILKRATGEIGMHLHAWNSPPLVTLTHDDCQHHPYLTEYPEPIMRDKIAFLTDLLEDTFGVKMTSHRAGRWGLNGQYARLLIERGYLADSSVTPHLSWRGHLGDPAQTGGPDYLGFPEAPYFIDPGDIRKPGDSPLLEIPVTVRKLQPQLVRSVVRRLPAGSLPRRVLNRFYPPTSWLYPPATHVKRMLRIMDAAAGEVRPCVNLALHSSELMAGGSPSFDRREDIDALYDDLALVFSAAAKMFRGVTVGEFRRDFSEGKESCLALSRARLKSS